MIIEVAVAPSFTEACERLENPDVKRVDRFIDKLVADPERAGTNFEIVRRQPDRNMRSARVSLEMRAIGYQCGPTLTLLWVDHHDAAYAWARAKCVVCHPITGRVVGLEDVEPED